SPGRGTPPLPTSSRRDCGDPARSSRGPSKPAAAPDPAWSGIAKNPWCDITAVDSAERRSGIKSSGLRAEPWGSRWGSPRAVTKAARKIAAVVRLGYHVCREANGASRYVDAKSRVRGVRQGAKRRSKSEVVRVSAVETTHVRVCDYDVLLQRA